MQSGSETLRTKRSNPRAFSLPAWLLLPALFGLALLLFYPFRFVFEFDTDEGINLIKALLHYRGYALYSDIYSDQPPVFTYFLSALFRLVEPNVNLARLGVIGFSMLLLASAMAYLRRTWGSAHALASFFLIILLPNYPRLSVSVMIGLPAIALALAAVAFYALWEHSRTYPPLIASALLMALAVLTKAFVAPLGLFLGLGVLLRGIAQNDTQGGLLASPKPALVWGALSAGILLLTALFIGPEGLSQLTQSHTAALNNSIFISQSKSFNIHRYLRDAWGVLIMGAIGAAWAVVRRKFSALILGLWCLAGYLALANTVPVWYHHQLVVTVPAAVLAAIPVGELLGFLRRRLRQHQLPSSASIAGALALGVMLWTQAVHIQPLLRQLEFDFPNLWRDTSEPSLNWVVLARMSDEKNETEMLVTDHPMFAFRLGNSVPPGLAVFSIKRFVGGLLTEEDVIAAIIETDPDQVLLARHPMPRVEDFLTGSYTTSYKNDPYRFYIRRPE